MTYDRDLVDRLQRNQVAGALDQAIALLRNNGILEALRNIGKISFTPADSKTLENYAFKGAYYAGYNEAIDNLINFRELFLEQRPSEPKKVPMDFGGVHKAVSEGYMTKEEMETYERGDSK